MKSLHRAHNHLWLGQGRRGDLVPPAMAPSVFAPSASEPCAQGGVADRPAAEEAELLIHQELKLVQR